jgi:hypothetical protein
MAMGVLQTHLCQQRPAPLVDIDQSQHRKYTVGVLGQATIAHLGKALDALELEKRVFDFCPCLAFGAVDLLVTLG